MLYDAVYKQLGVRLGFCIIFLLPVVA